MAACRQLQSACASPDDGQLVQLMAAELVALLQTRSFQLSAATFAALGLLCSQHKTSQDLCMLLHGNVALLRSALSSTDFLVAVEQLDVDALVHVAEAVFAFGCGSRMCDVPAIAAFLPAAEMTASKGSPNEHAVADHVASLRLACAMLYEAAMLQQPEALQRPRDTLLAAALQLADMSMRSFLHWEQMQGEEAADMAESCAECVQWSFEAAANLAILGTDCRLPPVITDELFDSKELGHPLPADLAQEAIACMLQLLDLLSDAPCTTLQWHIFMPEAAFIARCACAALSHEQQAAYVLQLQNVWLATWRGLRSLLPSADDAAAADIGRLAAIACHCTRCMYDCGTAMGTEQQLSALTEQLRWTVALCADSKLADQAAARPLLFACTSDGTELVTIADQAAVLAIATAAALLHAAALLCRNHDRRQFTIGWPNAGVLTALPAHAEQGFSREARAACKLDVTFLGQIDTFLAAAVALPLDTNSSPSHIDEFAQAAVSVLTAQQSVIRYFLLEKPGTDFAAHRSLLIATYSAACRLLALSVGAASAITLHTFANGSMMQSLVDAIGVLILPRELRTRSVKVRLLITGMCLHKCKTSTAADGLVPQLQPQ